MTSEVQERKVIESGAVFISSSSRSLRGPKVASKAVGFGTIRGNSAVAVHGVVPRVQRLGPSRGTVSSANSFFRTLRGDVVGFESLRQSVGGLRNGGAVRRRVVPLQGFGHCFSRVRKIEIRSAASSTLRGASPGSCPSRRLLRGPLSQVTDVVHSGGGFSPASSRSKPEGACQPSPSRENHEQAIPTQALKRTAGAFSTDGGRITGVAVSHLWWQRRPAA